MRGFGLNTSLCSWSLDFLTGGCSQFRSVASSAITMKEHQQAAWWTTNNLSPYISEGEYQVYQVYSFWLSTAQSSVQILEDISSHTSHMTESTGMWGGEEESPSRHPHTRLSQSSWRHTAEPPSTHPHNRLSLTSWKVIPEPPSTCLLIRLSKTVHTLMTNQWLWCSEGQRHKIPGNADVSWTSHEVGLHWLKEVSLIPSVLTLSYHRLHKDACWSHTADRWWHCWRGSKHKVTGTVHFRLCIKQKAHQCLHVLRQLKEVSLLPPDLPPSTEAPFRES